MLPLFPKPSESRPKETVMKDAIKKMKELATKHHEGQLRKDDKTPYIEHPKAVVAQLKKWGYDKGDDAWVLAVAWGHDLLEDTECTEQEIRDACGDYADKVLEGIRLLTRDKEIFPVKNDYICNVAEKAPLPLLAVKIADRLCNTRDFLALGRKEKAHAYFLAGTPLFDAPTLTNARIVRSIRHTQIIVS